LAVGFLQKEKEIKLTYPVSKGPSLMYGREHCMHPYPCICKEVVSRFESMTNWSPRHNITAKLGLAVKQSYFKEKKMEEWRMTWLIFNQD